MGTHGYLGYIIRGKRKGTFVQYNAYPHGLGADIAAFILSLTEDDYQRMVDRLNEIEWVDDREAAPADLVQRYTDEGFYSGTPKTDILGRSQAELKEHPSQWEVLLHDIEGSKSLQPILDGRLRHLIDGSSWGRLQWAYWLDFENRVMFVEGELDAEWPFEKMKVKGGFWDRLVQERQRWR